jgi:hypothetical protein
MGRSVSTHSYSEAVVYLHGVVSDDAESWEWSDFICDLQAVLSCKFKSFSDCDRWEGRENHVILENARAEVSVAEYCGLVSVCLAPRDPDNALDGGWCSGVAASFRKTLHKAYPNAALNRLGTASNGEAFFTPINRPEGVVTSKEGVLW